MKKDEIIQQAVQYIERLFAGNSDGHDAQHTMRVYRNAQYILESYPEADRFITLLAALLHDADDHKLFKTENHENAGCFLREHGIPNDTLLPVHGRQRVFCVCRSDCHSCTGILPTIAGDCPRTLRGINEPA